MPELNTVTFDAEQIMEQVQVFASAWSLVGGCFDSGSMLAEAESMKAELRTMIEKTLAAAPTPAAQSAGQEAGTFAQGLEAAAKWLEKRAADYVDEFGGVDPDTGTLEFGSGPHADLKHETHYEWIECAENIRKIAAPVNGGEREIELLRSRLADEERSHEQTIAQRDRAETKADELAYTAAAYLGIEIGEHSNLNCPWQNAIDRLASPPLAADAPQVGGDEREASLDSEVRAFLENLAKANSEPLNSVAAYKDRASRVDCMLYIRNHARALLARAALSAHGGDRKDAERAQWLLPRFVGYDFNWMPSSADAFDGRIVACFEVESKFRGGRDVAAAIDAAIAASTAKGA